MNKYNNGSSIPVDSLSKKELVEAIKEWSEGSKSLERLLLLCYINNIKTNGCHISDKTSYLEIQYNEEKEKLLTIFNEVLKHNKSDILFRPGAGNPFGGPDWSKPTLSFGYYTKKQEESDRNFDLVAYTLLKNKEVPKETPLDKVFDLFEYSINKNSSLSFRIVNDDGNYQFIIESRPIIDEEYNRYNQSFIKANLEEIDLPQDLKENKIYCWKIEDNNLETFLDKINNSISLIIKDDIIKVPTSESEIINFNRFAQYKKDTLCNTPEGKEEFEKWFMFEEEKYNKFWEQIDNPKNK